MSELIGNLVDVCISKMHDATKNTNTPAFPNGVITNEGYYTDEAQAHYKELFDIYKTIIDESKF